MDVLFICYVLRNIVSRYSAVSTEDATEKNLDVNTAKTRVFQLFVKSRRCNILDEGHKKLVLTVPVRPKLKMPLQGDESGKN